MTLACFVCALLGAAAAAAAITLLYVLLERPWSDWGDDW